jgi:predicted glycoside hydrolase/deacetylase ChbG (UPF0249 family)
MIIINADDFGRSVAETNAAASLFQRRRVTSFSAMVFMADSERAADLARDLDADVGLHLNFCEPWTNGNRVPKSIRAHQDSLVTFFNSNRYAFLMYNPKLRRSFEAVYHAEVDEFVRLYGRPPSRFDGHRHLHLCANMLIDGLIPSGSIVRRNFTFGPGEKGLLNRAYRWLVDAYLLRRNYALSDYFFSLEQCLNGRGRSLNLVAELAKGASVEVMTHPKNVDEFTYLSGEGYVDSLGSAQRGTYSELPVKARFSIEYPMLWSVLASLWECALI